MHELRQRNCLCWQSEAAVRRGNPVEEGRLAPFARAVLAMAKKSLPASPGFRKRALWFV